MSKGIPYNKHEYRLKQKPESDIKQKQKFIS